MLRYFHVFAAFALLACDGGSDASQKNLGGDLGVGPCPNSTSSPIAWDEMTELGVTPGEAFDAVAGSCQTDFHWDASGAEVDVTPRAGSAEITVELAIDHDSAQLRRFDSGDAMHIEASCAPALQARAEVHISTDDGVFDVRGTIDLAFRAQGGVMLSPISVDVADHDGSLSVPLANNQSAELVFSLAGADPEQCTGELQLQVSSMKGNQGMGSEGRVGAWSSTGCGLRELPIALDDPFGPVEGSLREQILARFARLQLPGRWDDGAQTELDLRLEVPGEVVCAEDGAVSAALVPVRVTFATQDDAIAEHTTEQATVRATRLRRDQEPLQLWIDEELSCGSSGDTLPYALADCETLASVRVQLGINAGTRLESGEGLRAYETHRGGNRDGAADELRVLMLAFPPGP